MEGELVSPLAMVAMTAGHALCIYKDPQNAPPHAHQHSRAARLPKAEQPSSREVHPAQRSAAAVAVAGPHSTSRQQSVIDLLQAADVAKLSRLHQAHDEVDHSHQEAEAARHQVGNAQEGVVPTHPAA